MDHPIIFPPSQALTGEDEFDPKDKGMDMSAWLKQFKEHFPLHDQTALKADQLPF